MKRLFTLLMLAFVAMSCEQIQDFIDDKGHGLVFLEGEMKAYFDDKGDTKNYKFKADLAWSAEVSANWVEVDPTSGPAGENKIKIKVDKNKSDEKRTGYVDITLSNDKSYRIELEQLAAGENLDDVIPSISIPNNQIWYTSIDGEIVEPNDPMAFNVSIKSNIYEDGKGVITFDGEVTEVGELAFYGCNDCTTNCYKLTSFILPQSVTSISNLAFYGCRNLQSVTISDNVIHIGAAAFICCTRLKKFNSKFASEDGRCLIIDGVLNSFAPAGLAEYTIPDSVTTIGEWAFHQCSSLASVTIPDSVTTIGKGAFCDCSSLTSVTIGDSVTTIGEGAFYNCSSLTSATIPDSVTTIGDGAFYHCSSLTSIIIPDSVTTIGNWAFEGCSSLTSVTIPDSVTSIGVAFFGCTGELVVNCNIPDASYFDSSTFYGSQFTSVTIGDSVTTIGRWAFAWCSSLTSVTIGDGVTTIGDGVFFGCDSLTKFNGKFVSEDGRCLIVDDTLMSFAIGCGATEYVIPPSVTVIGHYAFYRCFSLTSVTIPDSVTTIGHQSFNQCTGLTSVVIPDSVTIIGGYAFSGCDSLTSVTIGNSVIQIGGNAFYDCQNIQAVYISDLLAWCNINFECHLTEFVSIAANPLYCGANLYLNGEVVTDLVVPDGVTEIRMMSFFGCSSLTSITIPDSVTEIGYAAFAGCSRLTIAYCKSVTPPTALFDNRSYLWNGFSQNTIYVPMESVEAYKSAEGWSEYADAIEGYNFIDNGDNGDDTEIGITKTEPEFDEIWYTNGSTTEATNPYNTDSFGCAILSNTYDESIEKWVIKFDGWLYTIGYEAFCNCEDIISITLPHSVTTLSEYAFYGGRNLTDISLTDSVTTIEGGAFQDCSGLTNIVIPDSVTTIGSYAFSGCISLTDVTLSNGITTIDNGVFAWCQSLKNVDIPAQVTSIGNDVFYDCRSLESICIPDSVTSIGVCAYQGCSSLTSVTIPENVTNIGGYAFSGTMNLSTVYCKATTPPTYGGNVFQQEVSDITIYVPMDSIEDYKTAIGWKSYAESFVGYDF